ncbi:transcriptional regulator, RpiR family [Pilibacter termitis]|uniref:Transcriptional regulator, RpiR family n=1 Tax=Pilibacter termitis TaxID=263852 RepID=A0A1T4N7L3_9ENTE|nr:MurR/RpiR family transcriptional regulator [Pilibacter termitis]SJZ75224.1 transcriptional regulator, RpiR family [Pilibacter termitis]
MFDEEKVNSLNELELEVYRYIIGNYEDITSLTIRELAQKIHVSTSTIVRFATKMGFQGYSELKYHLKKKIKESSDIENYYENMNEVELFLRKLATKEYQEKIQPVIEMIQKAKMTVFSGMGTSGALANYGARYFSNLGIVSFSITDPYHPIYQGDYPDILFIILSVSGETIQMIHQVEEIKRGGAKVLAITNNEHSTIARLADKNLSYYVKDEMLSSLSVQLTTQLPVIALIEVLAHKAQP